MDISNIDIAVIIVYLIAIAVFGSLMGGTQKSTNDYFLGGRNVAWWAVAFSIVAAETSSLTFISIPGLAYLTNLNFLQLTLGFVAARIIIAWVFLPAYAKGKMETAYTFLEHRFGLRTRKLASAIFMLTRIAADGVRLFSTAIPLALIFKTIPALSGWSTVHIYIASIIVIGAVSLIYTYTGGIKGVIWADVVQMFIYIGGALLALFVLLDDGATLTPAIEAGKTALFNFDIGGAFSGIFTRPYTFWGAFIGGAFLSMASHGTDQLIVQRLLTTKNLKDGQKAIISSGVIVMGQFTLFLFIGLLLYSYYGRMALTDTAAPFHKADEIFPYFIIHTLPTGARGLIIAGLFAAAMSTLAGSMSSLSSAFIMDFRSSRKGDNKNPLHTSRKVTMLAAAILMGIAMLFIPLSHSVVEVALGIASITYGGLLGTFLMGLLSKTARERNALAGFTGAVLVMLVVSLYPLFTGQPALMHWTWYVFTGTLVALTIGKITDWIPAASE